MTSYLKECLLLLLVMLAHPIWPAEGEYTSNCTDQATELTTCGHITANGCCPKGCIRNARGRCVEEKCTGSWNGFLERPLTMSCHFHWFLIFVAIVISSIMAGMICANLAFEIRECLRKRRLARYRQFSDISGSSFIGSTQC
ncbi:uncharacterized protein Dwil_GK13102 [Drosophila willistoni]|uniref:TIL domain-containing protein n=1 Tax=Drosophila willistoni TaxID=7260 RepID=B4NH10_DROWI|nr:uncharacterized protein LOC6651405 [Drosophila willistoni]EDW84507.1 uncharacterized protein Dwil_GK13102 [Drosophila willistoni]